MKLSTTLKLKTQVRAGIGLCGKGRICVPSDPNHNQTINMKLSTTLKLKTQVRAGLGMCGKGRICQPTEPNHNQSMR